MAFRFPVAAPTAKPWTATLDAGPPTRTNILQSYSTPTAASASYRGLHDYNRGTEYTMV